MTFNPFKSRYAVLYAFALFFIIASQLVRIIFIYTSLQKIHLTLQSATTILLKGFVFDFGVILYFTFFYSIYLLLLPQKFVRSIFNKAVNYLLLFLMILI